MALLAGCVVQEQRAVPPGRFYAEFTARIQALGGYRTERVAADAPFSNADLIRNFELVALREEYDSSEPGFVESQAQTRLTRWEGPLKIKLFGTRATDRTIIHELGRRLQALSGRSVSFTNYSESNITVFVLDAEGRSELLAGLAEKTDAQDTLYLSEWATSNLFPCIVTTYRQDEFRPGVITSAILFVKDELEGVLRESCFHEELTQAMGLGNDHPDVRPSMFNDDEEFAFLTEHDEFLMRILYHPALKPNMSAAEVLPLLPEIIDELRPEEN